MRVTTNTRCSILPLVALLDDGNRCSFPLCYTPHNAVQCSLIPRHPHLVKLARAADAEGRKDGCSAIASPKIIPTSLHAPLTDEIILLIDNSVHCNCIPY